MHHMDRIINDFTINIATANGTGSQSANLILLQSLFDMGVPVSGKNLFPSNISGLPTWYIVRLSDEGYQAPGDRTHIQVLVNPATWEEDLAALEPGSVVIWNSDTKKKTVEREDIISYPVPMSSLARKINPKIAKLVTNIIYVGVLAELLGIDQACLESAVAKQFKGKATAVELNITALGLGRDYCKEHLTKEDAYAVEARKVDKPQFFIEGNEAAALGAHYGGVQLLAWYPITPSSSMAEGIISYIPRLRTDAEGKATMAVIQAEDELAAAGMVLGAGWAGGRGMTATSGPGISLMQEFIGLAYFAEIPSVFWDVTRVGPSTGLPTRTQQSDIAMLYEGSHGDTQHIVLIPGTVEECFEYGWRAFDYSERFQTPVFGMSDLDLGMNRWACEGFRIPTSPWTEARSCVNKTSSKPSKHLADTSMSTAMASPTEPFPARAWRPFCTAVRVTTPWAFTRKSRRLLQPHAALANEDRQRPRRTTSTYFARRGRVRSRHRFPRQYGELHSGNRRYPRASWHDGQPMPCSRLTVPLGSGSLRASP